MHKPLTGSRFVKRVLAGLLLSAIVHAHEPEVVSRRTYERAERFLDANRGEAVYNNNLAHTWIEGADALWYRRTSEEGWQFIRAEPAAARKAPAFDHAKMARALGNALGATLDANRLPIDELTFSHGNVQVTAQGKRFDCNARLLACAPGATAARDPNRSYSPDGKHAVFARDSNLWVADLLTGEERELTRDGTQLDGYATSPGSSVEAVTRQRRNKPTPPSGEFSPDGKQFVSYRLDETRVPELHLLQHVPEDGSFRPKLWTYSYAFPGDPLARAQLYVFDLASGMATKAGHPPLVPDFNDPITLDRVTWSPDGRSFHVLDSRSSYRELTLTRVNAATGSATQLLSENNDAGIRPETLLDDAPTRAFLANGDFIWSSDRSGWRHLYMYGPDGTLKQPITQGPWLVRELLRVDEPARTIYFSASGRERGQDPYFRHIYKVRFDGTKLQRLTMEEADHGVSIVRSQQFRREYPGGPVPGQGGFSASGRYFVDAYSRPDRATVTVIRDRNGRVAMTLEVARLAADLARDYVPVEPFEARAADGDTALYGSIFKPAGFDPAKRYPVVDAIYPGPQSARVRKRFLADDAQALAELGFIVVALDGRGTPLRSREFLDHSYGHMEKAGFLEDHVAVLRELSRTRPYMDIERVGIHGTSGGAFATVHAMFDYPEFFKVGVASAGSHDKRSYMSFWGAAYHGPYDARSYAGIASYRNADRFTGKLLLAAGDMDDNVHPANTLRVADVLISKNKPFDMLIMPNVEHGIAWHPYFVRRLWDYFVVNLRSAQPPQDFAMGQVYAR